MLEINPVIFQLSNGVRVVYVRREAFVAHLGVMIHAGSRFETEEEQGLAHFIEHCIFKGTEKRSALDVLTDLDSVGGELNAYTNKEEVCFHASFRKLHFPIACDLLSDIVINSQFLEGELKKEKEVILDEIISYQDNPQERIFDEFEGHLFHGHSLGYNTLGEKKTVKNLTRDSLRAYVDRYFTADRTVISFVGDVPLDEVRDHLEKAFHSMKASKDAAEMLAPSHHMFNLNEKKANYQSHVLIGGIAPSYMHEDRRGMTLLTNMLGGPALNSILGLLIREQHGYAYNVEANYTSYADTGFWNVYLGTDKKYLSKSIDLVRDQLQRLCSGGISEADLRQGKEQLKGHIALSMDSNLELMFSLAKSMLIFNRVDGIQEIYDQINNINSSEIGQLLNRFMNPDQLSELVFEY